MGYVYIGRTAMLAAVARGNHRLTDWQEMSDRLASLFPERLARKANAGISVRSRFAEDHLESAALVST